MSCANQRGELVVAHADELEQVVPRERIGEQVDQLVAQLVALQVDVEDVVVVRPHVAQQLSRGFDGQTAVAQTEHLQALGGLQQVCEEVGVSEGRVVEDEELVDAVG